VPHLRQV